MNDERFAGLSDVLVEAERLGFLTDAARQADLAVRFTEAVEAGGWWTDGDTGIDLGSGGGVPGLALALALPGDWHFVEVSGTRARFLRRAAQTLHLDHVRVHELDAAAARTSSLAGTASVVSARSFAGPSATAEAGAPLLRPQGVVVVAEPPEGDRWPLVELALLGLRPIHSVDGPPRLQVLQRDASLPLAGSRSFKAMKASPRF